MMQSAAADGEGADSSAICLQVATQLRLNSVEIPPPTASTVQMPTLPTSTKDP